MGMVLQVLTLTVTVTLIKRLNNLSMLPGYLITLACAISRWKQSNCVLQFWRRWGRTILRKNWSYRALRFRLWFTGLRQHATRSFGLRLLSTKICRGTQATCINSTLTLAPGDPANFWKASSWCLITGLSELMLKLELTIILPANLLLASLTYASDQFRAKLHAALGTRAG